MKTIPRPAPRRSSTATPSPASALILARTELRRLASSPPQGRIAGWSQLRSSTAAAGSAAPRRRSSAGPAFFCCIRLMRLVTTFEWSTLAHPAHPTAPVPRRASQATSRASARWCRRWCNRPLTCTRHIDLLAPAIGALPQLSWACCSRRCC